THRTTAVFFTAALTFALKRSSFYSGLRTPLYIHISLRTDRDPTVLRTYCAVSCNLCTTRSNALPPVKQHSNTLSAFRVHDLMKLFWVICVPGLIITVLFPALGVR
ncbi:hypothetical protein C8Q74DRAFT_1276995, partial [Fomes fomentarius]